MNTKTMRLPPRRVLMSSKRKDRDEFDLKPTPTKLPKPPTPRPAPDKAAQPLPPNSTHLLAGYLAHEFLTTGTLFGQPWDPDRAPPTPQPDESKTCNGGDTERAAPSRDGSEAEPREGVDEKRQRYVEVASLLRTDGVHLAGIVNPSQLARLLQM